MSFFKRAVKLYSNEIHHLQVRMCKLYLKGSCSKGEECKDSHDVEQYRNRLKLLIGVGHDIPVDKSDYWRFRKTSNLAELSEEESAYFDPAICYERSKDKVCGICLDVVLEKENDEQRRFGLLLKCKHVFCITCIRQWRKRKLSCPECRRTSTYIVPSSFHIDNKQAKEKVFIDYMFAFAEIYCNFDEKSIFDYLQQRIQYPKECSCKPLCTSFGTFEAFG